MLSNDAFRSLVSSGALRPPTPPPPPPPRRPKSAAAFATQALAAEAVVRAVAEKVPLRQSTGLASVPAASRNAVFACAAETLKSLPRLRAVLEASALWPSHLDP